jgi:hypothetical protein
MRLRRDPNAPLPPAFPAKLVKRYRILEGAAHNELFQFFRERRARSNSTRILSWVRAFGFAYALAIAGALPPLIYIFAHYFLTSKWPAEGIAIFKWMILFGFVVIVVSSFFDFRRHRGDRVPLRLSEAFHARGVHAALATDLWLSGYPASRLAEAIFLEKYEARRHLPTAIVIIGLIWTNMEFLSKVHWDSPFTWIAVALNFVIFHKISGIFADLMIFGCGAEELRRRYATWMGLNAKERIGRNVRHEMDEGIGKHAAIVLSAIGKALSLGGVAALIVGLIVQGLFPGALTKYFDTKDAGALTIPLLLLILLVVRNIRIAVYGWAEYQSMRAIAAAEVPVTALMMAQVLDDPDASRYLDRDKMQHDRERPIQRLSGLESRTLRRRI